MYRLLWPRKVQGDNVQGDDHDGSKARRASKLTVDELEAAESYRERHKFVTNDAFQRGNVVLETTTLTMKGGHLL